MYRNLSLFDKLTPCYRRPAVQPEYVKWKYSLYGQPVSLSLGQLNQLGDEGWELVCHDTMPDKPKYHGYIFKRPKREIPDQPALLHEKKVQKQTWETNDPAGAIRSLTNEGWTLVSAQLRKGSKHIYEIAFEREISKPVEKPPETITEEQFQQQTAEIHEARREHASLTEPTP